MTPDEKKELAISVFKFNFGSKLKAPEPLKLTGRTTEELRVPTFPIKDLVPFPEDPELLDSTFLRIAEMRDKK